MIPLKIDYKNFERKPHLNSLIEEQVERLEKHFDRITSCHVVVSKPHKRHQHGNVYHVHIDLHIPGNVVAITREPERDGRHDDLPLAIRDAFKTAKRNLQTYIDKLRKDIKFHEPAATPPSINTMAYASE